MDLNKIPIPECDNGKLHPLIFNNYLIYRDSCKFFSMYASQELEKPKINVAEVTEAANVGDHESDFILGKYYFNTLFKKEKAFQYFLRAAESGIVDAQCAVGYCYLFGKGVTVNIDAAIHYLSMSPKGLNMLGFAYYIGNSEKLPRDFNLSFSYFQEAAAKGGDDHSSCILKMIIMVDGKYTRVESLYTQERI